MSYWLRCESVENGQYGTIEVHGLRGTITYVDSLPYLLNMTLLGLEIPAAITGHYLTIHALDPQGVEFQTNTLSVPSFISPTNQVCCAVELRIPILQFGIYSFRIGGYDNLVNDDVIIEVRQGDAPRSGLPTVLEDQVAFDPGDKEQAITWISGLVARGLRSVQIVDPYWDQAAYAAVAPSLRKGVEFTLYTKRPLSGEQRRIDEVFLTDEFHDRYVVLDSSEYWHLGSSINCMGMRQTVASRLRSPTIIQSTQARLDSARSH